MALLEPGQGVEGMVLAAYGLGTIPTDTPDLGGLMARVVERGIDVVVVTQSSGHISLGKYANSRALQRAGVISGGAMSVEAAVTKLMHGLAHFSDRRDRRAYLLADTAGERGVKPASMRASMPGGSS